MATKMPTITMDELKKASKINLLDRERKRELEKFAASLSTEKKDEPPFHEFDEADELIEKLLNNKEFKNLIYNQCLKAIEDFELGEKANG